MTKYVGLIFARGGSKGLPGKNIRMLHGKPLIAWSIEHARAVKRIDEIIVSTDCPDIAEVAKRFGAHVPFIRPAHLAQDDSPERLAWRHALDFLKQRDGAYPDAMVSIPATAPLRSPQDIENCLDEYEHGDADVVITMSEAHRNPYFNMVKRNEDGTVGLVLAAPSGVFRRQDAPAVYDVTTVAYVANSRYVMEKDGLFDGRVRAVNVPVERALDIDTILDFRMAEMLLEARDV